jgi:hypothetical protein
MYKIVFNKFTYYNRYVQITLIRLQKLIVFKMIYTQICRARKVVHSTYLKQIIIA